MREDPSPPDTPRNVAEEAARLARCGDPLPESWSPELRALVTEARGDWDGAHRMVQELETRAAAWVHAYLHRREGDLANAGYWYRRAGRSPSSADLEIEWREIVSALSGDPE